MPIPTGRKRGAKLGERRTPGAVARLVAEDAALQAAFEIKLARLTPEERENIKPKLAFSIALQVAVEARNLGLMVSVAEKAAPYFHPKLATQTIQRGNDDAEANKSDEELMAEVAALRARTRNSKPGLYDPKSDPDAAEE